MKKGGGKNVQATSTEDDQKTDALPFWELYLPYHVHGEDIDVDISDGVG